MRNENNIEAWNKVLKASLAFPGVKIDRTSFLRKELSKYYSSEIVEMAIEHTPAVANIPKETIDKISEGCIDWHITQVTAISFAAGIPGGWWMAATVPTDISQFYFHVLQLIQKLAYLYGWPEIYDIKSDFDDETLMTFTLFVGVALGSTEAIKVITDISKRIANEVIKRLPQKALTKYGFYNIAKQIAKWIGIKMTKEVFAKGLSKVVPIVGGLVSGTVTYLSFKPMAERLKNHFRSLPLAGED